MKGMTERPHESVNVPILCRFWREDDVWNGSAEDLAVAVFGDSFDACMDNLRTAVEAHMNTITGADKGSDLVAYLLDRAKVYGFLTVEDLPSVPVYKMSISMRDQEVVAVN